MLTYHKILADLFITKVLPGRSVLYLFLIHFTAVLLFLLHQSITHNNHSLHSMIIFNNSIYLSLFNPSSLNPNLYNVCSPRKHNKQVHNYKPIGVFKYYFCEAFSKNIQVDSVYKDFSKAFVRQSQPHHLCEKLKNMDNTWLYWFYLALYHGGLNLTYPEEFNWLVKGEVSALVSITSGVTQGSHLGPLICS